MVDMYRIRWELETEIGELLLANDSKANDSKMERQQEQDNTELQAGRLVGANWIH